MHTGCNDQPGSFEHKEINRTDFFSPLLQNIYLKRDKFPAAALVHVDGAKMGSSVCLLPEN